MAEVAAISVKKKTFLADIMPCLLFHSFICFYLVHFFEVLTLFLVLTTSAVVVIWCSCNYCDNVQTRSYMYTCYICL